MFLRTLASQILILSTFFVTTPFTILRCIFIKTRTLDQSKAPNIVQRWLDSLSKIKLMYETWLRIQPRLFPRRLADVQKAPFDRLYILLEPRQAKTFDDTYFPAKLSTNDRQSISQAVWYPAPHSELRIGNDARSDKQSVILYFHGGAFISLGADHDLFRVTLHEFAKAASTDIFAVAYRLAPGSKFPSQLYEAFTAYEHLVAQGYKRIIVAGDSAGGNIALQLYHYLATHKSPSLAHLTGLVLFTPWIDLAGRCADRAQLIRPDDHLPAYYTDQGWKAVRPNSSSLTATNKWISPYEWRKVAPELLQHLPPTYILVGTLDVLSPEVQDFASAAQEAHAKALVLDVEDGGVHDFILLPWYAAKAKAALQRVSAWIEQL